MVVVVACVVIVTGVKTSGRSIVDVSVAVGDVVVDVGEMDIRVIFCRVINHDSQKVVELAFVLGEWKTGKLCFPQTAPLIVPD